MSAIAYGRVGVGVWPTSRLSKTIVRWRAANAWTWSTQARWSSRGPSRRAAARRLPAPRSTALTDWRRRTAWASRAGPWRVLGSLSRAMDARSLARLHGAARVASAPASSPRPDLPARAWIGADRRPPPGRRARAGVRRARRAIGLGVSQRGRRGLRRAAVGARGRRSPTPPTSSPRCAPATRCRRFRSAGVGADRRRLGRDRALAATARSTRCRRRRACASRSSTACRTRRPWASSDRDPSESIR